MTTTNQKSVIDIQKIKRKDSKHNKRESHQITREERKKGAEKNYKNNQKGQHIP